MTWLRRHRRRFALFSALVFVLQGLAVVVASGAHAAVANGDSENLVVICTGDGIKLIDLANPDAEPKSLGQHQCPLCIIGCAACATPAVDPTLLTTVIALLLPAETHAAPIAAVSVLPQFGVIAKSTSPRGPPPAI